MHRYKLPRLVPVWALLTLLTACDFTDKKPGNLIPADKMVNVLAEVHLAESKVSRLNLRGTDSANLVYKRLEQAIFKKYQVDTSAYTKSYIYYSSHPAEFEVLYQRVVEKLQKRTAPKKDTTKKG